MTRFFARNKSILFKWFISYLLILLIPLGTWLFLYGRMEKIVTDDAIQYNAAVMNASIRSIEEITDHINQTNKMLSANRRLKKISLWDGINDPEERYEIKLLNEDLFGAMTAHSVIYEMYVYFPKMDQCVYAGGIMKSREFFQSYYQGGEEDYQRWKRGLMESAFFRQEIHRIFKMSSTKAMECIAFIQPFPLATKDVNAVCVNLVRKQELAEGFHRTEKEDEPTTFAVVDNRNRVLLQSGREELSVEQLAGIQESGQQKINGEDYYILRKDLNSPAWSIYAVIPMNWVLADLRSVRSWSILMLMAYLVLCSVLVILMLRYNYTPVKSLLNNIADGLNIVYDNKTDEYALIEKVFRETLDQNHAIANLLEKKDDVLKQNFFNTVLRGGCSQSEWEDSLRQFDIHPASSQFVVVLFHVEEVSAIFPEDEKLDDWERRQAGNFIILNIMTELLQGQNTVMGTVINDMPVCIVNLPENGNEKGLENIRQDIHEGQKAVREYFNFSILATVSNVHDTYVGICDAYAETVDAMEYRMLYNEGAIIYYKDLPVPESGSYYYPLENERILINYIKNGDLESAQKIVDEIYEINFRRNVLPLPLAKCLMSDMASTMIKTLGEISSNSKEKFQSSTASVNHLLTCENIYEMQKIMRQLLSEVCGYVNAKGDQRLQQQVKEFVEQNYSNSQLTVAAIAAYLGLHPTYLSTAFKEKTGVRLLDYIMRFRIRKAKEILNQDQRSSVEEIANRVGYDNLRTFVRVFKKYEGVTPVQYRSVARSISENQNSDEEESI